MQHLLRLLLRDEQTVVAGLEISFGTTADLHPVVNALILYADGDFSFKLPEGHVVQKVDWLAAKDANGVQLNIAPARMEAVVNYKDCAGGRDKTRL